MKLKSKSKRWRPFSLAILFLATALAGTYVSIHPSLASAAGSSGVPTVFGKSTVQCAPTIQGPTAGDSALYSVIIASKSPSTSTFYDLSQGVVGSSTAATKTFKAIYDKQNVLVLAFTGADKAASSDNACAGSLAFFRTVDATAKNTFYGLWNCNDPSKTTGSTVCPNNKYRVVTATVDPKAQTLTFTLPNGVKGNVHLAQEAGQLSNTQYFPGASSGTGTGAGSGTTKTLATCLKQYLNSNIGKNCLDGRSAAFIDIAHITFDGETYTAGQWGGSSKVNYSLDPGSTNAALQALSPKFVIDTSSGGGQTDINIDGDGKSVSQLQQFSDAINRKGKDGTVDITYDVAGASGTNKVSTAMSGLDKVATYYPKTDTVQIDFTNGAGDNESHYYGSYTRVDAKHYALTDGGYSGCGTQGVPQFIFSSGDPKNMNSTRDGITPASWSMWANSSPCAGTNVPVTVVIAPGTATPPVMSTAGQNPADATESPTCESSGFSLSWIMCPIINGMASAADGAYDNIVKPLLVTRPININDKSDKASQAIYKVWSNFRIYGDVFLVIALLVIVFGQSLGGGAIDAYTAKKVLPRLLIAAVLINLSIYIVALMVDLANIVGGGLISLITAPFSQSGNFDITLNGTTSGLGLVALLGGGIWAVAAFGALLEFLLAFVLLPAFFIVLSIMITVLLRRGLIIFLVIISPVAFALYCLPNTEQYFRKWWDLLFKTLLVYPIIAALFAIAKVLSVTIGWGGETSGLTSTFANILSIVALFVPLALIPFAFKIAGGVLGRAHELTSNYGKRAHQGILGNVNDQTSWRNRAKRRLGAANAELGLSKQGIGATLNPRTAFSKSQRQANRAAVRNMYQGVYGQQGMGAQMYEQNKDDSNITGDLAHYASSKKSRAAIEADIAAGKFARGSAEHQQRLFSSAAADRIGRDPSMRRKALMNPATIGYAIGAGEQGWNEAESIMHDIAGNDEGTYRSMQNEFQYLAKSAAGRSDLAAAVDGGAYNGYKAWGQVGMYQHGNGKPKSIQGAAEYFGGYTDGAGNNHVGLWQRAQTPAGLTAQDVANFGGVTEADYTAATPLMQASYQTRASENAKDAVAIFTKEIGNMGDGATGSVRDEALKQRAALITKGGGVGGALEQRINTEPVRKAARGYDREEMQRRQAAGDI